MISFYSSNTKCKLRNAILLFILWMGVEALLYPCDLWNSWKLNHSLHCWPCSLNNYFRYDQKQYSSSVGIFFGHCITFSFAKFLYWTPDYNLIYLLFHYFIHPIRYSSLPIQQHQTLPIHETANISPVISATSCLFPIILPMICKAPWKQSCRTWANIIAMDSSSYDKAIKGYKVDFHITDTFHTFFTTHLGLGF